MDGARIVLFEAGKDPALTKAGLVTPQSDTMRQVQPEPRLQLAHLPQLSCHFLASLEAGLCSHGDTAVMFKVGCIA